MSLTATSPILILEDSHEDFEAIRRTLRGEGLANPIFRCEDGDSALDFVYHRNKFADPADSPRPGLILLDLTVPATDGRAVLAEIKADEELRSIPIIVMTSSQNDQDIVNCYRDGANSYLKKPVNLKGLVEALKRLKEYWFEIVILPRPAP